jgi:hypothetical protein
MERDLPLPKTPKGTTLAPQRPGIRGMSAKTPLRQDQRSLARMLSLGPRRGDRRSATGPGQRPTVGENPSVELACSDIFKRAVSHVAHFGGANSLKPLATVSQNT